MAKKTPAGSNGNGGGDALKTLKAVYDFMQQNGLDAVEIVENGAQVKLVRRKANVQQVPVVIPVGASAPTGIGQTAISSHPVASHSAPSAQHAPAPVPAGTAVKSPMMGIFYRAPSPSSPPFCKDGDQVKAGQVICMIEAMKVFNEIKAEYPCTIVKCLVENGKPVKSGQDLIIIQR